MSGITLWALFVVNLAAMVGLLVVAVRGARSRDADAAATAARSSSVAGTASGKASASGPASPRVRTTRDDVRPAGTAQQRLAPPQGNPAQAGAGSGAPAPRDGAAEDRLSSAVPAFTMPAPREELVRMVDPFATQAPEDEPPPPFNRQFLLDYDLAWRIGRPPPAPSPREQLDAARWTLD